MQAAEFCVLGGVRAHVRGRDVDLGHARQRHVLVVLLVEANRPVSLDQLLDRVWGERAPRSAVTTLYSYLSRLRRALSTTELRLVRRPGGYTAETDPDAVDLHRFRALVHRARGASDQVAADLLQEALRLWAGEAFPAADTPWFTHLREVLTSERQAAELDLNDVLLRQGRESEVLPQLISGVSTHPFDERLAGQLMLALHRQGRTVRALEHYQVLRQNLDEELGLTPGASLQRLHQELLRAGPAGPPPAAPASVPTEASTAAPRPPVAPPRQLPLAPVGFISRHWELDELADLLVPRRPEPGPRPGPAPAPAPESEPGRIVVISAAGGVGKSWPAVRWAHDHADRFPDSQLYVDLRGFDPAGEPMSPVEALRGFLDALGVPPGAVPEDPQAQGGLYRSLLADKRILVVLDDAHDAQQVVPLLPGKGQCAVLITSRNRLTPLLVTHGAVTVSPTPFHSSQARELLAHRLDSSRLDAEPQAVAAIVDYCAGLPLALSLMAARVASHPQFPLAALADELADASSRLDVLDAGGMTVSLRTVLATSHRALSSSAGRLFALLGLVTSTDIGLDAATSLAGITRSRARTLLAELEAAHLVQQHRPGRYRMHDLAQLYAGELAALDRAQENAEARARLIDFYLHTAFAANLLLDGPHTPFRPDPEPPAQGCAPLAPANTTDALRWFTEEHACLLAAQESALTAGLPTQAVQLAWALISYQLGSHHLEEYSRVWHTALAAAEQQPENVLPRVLAHWRLGHFHGLSGRRSEALDHLHGALDLSEAAGDPTAQAHICRTLGRLWEMNGDDRKALSYATRALRLYQTLDNPIWQANQFNAVGWMHAQLGAYDEARDHCERAHGLFLKHGRPGDEASTLDSLGYIAHLTGDHAAALDYYRQALAQFRTLGNGYDEADTLARIAESHRALNRPDEARAAWAQALVLYREQEREAEISHAEEALGGPAG
ncbi:tetratricopeptide repeat protein [Streptomyces sp. ISL-99]|uniref:AfsR/SARP family transcriptional regulator n=1 Tax=Streptomyces sp. ISL-99 TaxID=2819193 RepID=UPI001BE754ED|nr:BTAD domain-containing putative transcriptional regulator [Streptomyces sp. ISL-99]MBT2530332.1 tetratricopeptide repeat protein [Streptomyces sp. ISL-99]